MPFVDLKKQFGLLEKDIRARMDAVLAHGRYIMGPEVGELEEKLAAFVGAKHAVGCGSGTDALLMALMALGVGPGDAVFTSPFTFIATAEVVTLLGATPVFVDVDPQTFNLDPAALARAVGALKAKDPAAHPLPAGYEALTPRGIIPVDIFGLPCDYDAIDAVAAEHGLWVVEDAAQSFGATYKGARTCSFGRIGCTSFFPAKPLGCYGDGGALFTDDADLAELLDSIRVHGKGSEKYDNVRTGVNGRLDTLQAAILLPKFAAFPAEIAQRQAVAERYAAGLADVEGVAVQRVPEGCASAWAQFSVLLPGGREAVQAALKQEGVPTAVYYPRPLHLQTAYAPLGYAAGSLPVCEDLSRRIVHVPMHPYLEEAQIGTICRAVAQAVA
ncbi:MAG: DegT/DnrJ/EryC1/StrS family aminotransferase [Desulfovibrionaceae bacterium]|nr:DegT/DnrJ/EryC1/StrS family aminotransferase [Desulfovibrionaceae bacterium]